MDASNSNSNSAIQAVAEVQVPAKPGSDHATASAQTALVQKSSKHATVMGMATNYPLKTFRQYVGSLRKTGFEGKIILAISQDPKAGVEDYLKIQNVTMKRIQKINCTYDLLEIRGRDKKNLNSHQIEVATCADPYPNLKIRWSRFALLRDYLEECKECTGPILISDVRDTFFQRDPFGPEAPPVTGLQVFEEFKEQRTTHWLVQGPVEKCKNIKIFNETMLCSGTTIATRNDMLRYLNDMVAEMRFWMQHEKCCCNDMNGDDQSIHNWLFYGSKQLATYGTAQPNRMGLVHTAGAQASRLFQAKRKKGMEELGLEQRAAVVMPFTSKEEEERGNWLGPEHGLTDPQGYLLDFNGERSFVVHQADRFGYPFEKWLWNHGPCKGL
ncbi:expressed unknown protein [Seminavis robusta]|uniref:Uncharacterized protein n=1 Tax=Seminavis robusta TaxID=568900 RepID=A0A9N8DBN4_9STRA|nr:expressed unknown protein [Seminavis robusta]|eukprot:Sro48_g028110.1 n/a (384) ;mRNA; f:23411-24562